MFKMTIDDKNIVAKLNKMAEDANPMATEIVTNLGAIAQRVARNTVPVDTGALKQSITLEVISNDSEISAAIGSSLEYAPHIEFGTSKKAPQPFLNPAARTAEQELSKVMEAVVKKYAK